MLLPKLPDYIQIQQQRPSAGQINSIARSSRRRTVMGSADGTFVPLIWGRKEIEALPCTWLVDGTTLYLVVRWCLGSAGGLGIEEIEKIYFNDEDVPGSVVIRNYLGDISQTPDSGLAGVISGYNDSLIYTRPGGQIGVAYSVFEIPAGVVGGIPRVKAVIKGRKVWDERATAIVYTENPALVLADVISDPVIGMGISCESSDAADWCDSLFNGAPRCQIGLVLDRPTDVANTLVPTLREYAECFTAHTGTGIKLVPDGPVEAPSATVTAKDMVNDTLIINVPDISNAPTVIECRYTEPFEIAENKPWQLRSVLSETEGIDAGTTQYIPSTVVFEGVTRSIEAGRKAVQRRLRLQAGPTFGWRAFDEALAYEVGDVIHIEHDIKNVDTLVRILDVAHDGPGRYQITAETYRADIYAPELPPDPSFGILPAGALLFDIGTGALPEGWTDLTATYDGRFVRGKASGDISTDAGDLDVVFAGGTFATAGAHNNTNTGQFLVNHSEAVIAGDENKLEGGGEAGGHTHTYTGDTVTINPQRYRTGLVQSDGAETTVPLRFAHLRMSEVAFDELVIVDGSGYPLAIGSTRGVAGVLQSTVDAGKTNTETDHAHPLRTTPNRGTEISFSEEVFTYLSAGGHDHDVTLTAEARPRSLRTLMYQGETDYPVRFGMIVGWSSGAVPDGWLLCDGEGGTPPIHGRVPRAQPDTSGVGQMLGDDTVRKTTATVPAGAHDHKGSSQGGSTTYRRRGHGNTQGNHAHPAIIEDVAYDMPRVEFRFIQYVGE